MSDVTQTQTPQDLKRQLEMIAECLPTSPFKETVTAVTGATIAELDRVTGQLARLYEAIAQADTGGSLRGGSPYHQILVDVAREVGQDNGLFDYWA